MNGVPAALFRRLANDPNILGKLVQNPKGLATELLLGPSGLIRHLLDRPHTGAPVQRSSRRCAALPKPGAMVSDGVQESPCIASTSSRAANVAGISAVATILGVTATVGVVAMLACAAAPRRAAGEG